MEAHHSGRFVPELTARLQQLSVMEASYTVDDGICEDDSWVESSVEMHPIPCDLRQYELKRLLRKTIKNNDYGLDFNPVYTRERNTEPEYNNPVTQEETHAAKSSESNSRNNGVPDMTSYDFNKVLEQMNKTMMAKI